MGQRNGTVPTNLQCPLCGGKTEFLFENNEDTLPRACTDCYALVWINDDGSVEYREAHPVVN
jgi:hypothetical protein